MTDQMPYQRDQLYEEVWSQPVTTVAKKYGVSDVAIHKACKRLNIPVPPRGYWARLAAGQVVPREPLPASDGPTTVLRFNKNASQHREPRQPIERLSYLDQALRERVLKTCAGLEVKGRLVNPHPLIGQDQEVRTGREKKAREDRNRPPGEWYGYADRSLSLSRLPTVDVNKDSLQRAYRILDCIFTTVEALGGRVRQDESKGHTQIVLQGETMRIRIRNSKEALALSIEEYEAPRKHWKDAKLKRLEDDAGSFVMGLFDCADAMRAAREKRRLDAKRRQQELSRRLRQQELERQENERFQVLEEAAADWQKARMIEGYVAALEAQAQSETDEAKRNRLLEYIAWAKDKIMWLDPLTAHEDPILGKRWQDDLEDEDEDLW